ncbi:potassium transporter Kup [Noviherbaspirillum sp. CPCC 100848]|uniref:Probable potassium transport system protein Kup n=1 Tax=Noviherbaspirillum album TaxID=3080276 RepID=A0ABU6J2A0_9BURK|nr:potassium transporter Kup [Noviherbaspirillum sp. CPCC 100848]MEC4717588.1 potassium transporter Kup [Noviherbaspirillum sp. CPCC 100848]
MSTAPHKSSLAALTLAAIGIVYGDIGTSPLYTMKEVFDEHHGIALNQANILGVVSLILWGLIIVISLKYVTLVLRADNRGEGGIMALTALALSSVAQRSRVHYPVMLLGMIGAGLFFGDGVITPAISVLSAMEGLEVATPALKPYVIPLTLAVLVGLYMLQSRGTAGIGRWFGPIVLVWFTTLAIMGLINIAGNPAILAAFNPLHAFRFMINNGWFAFVALGAIVLALTGAEALYADMGHFGRKSVRLAWFSVVFPALALNYLGQGALLLSNPAAVSNPFFQQLGPWSIFPLVVLSTMATVIASQATISGAFSVTQQAIALGFLPRMRIIYTSESEIGQIYIPVVNWLQLIAVVLAVVGFGSSSNLASAYGIAATATMLITTLLTFFVVRHGWKFPLPVILASTAFFLAIDISLFSSTSLKIVSGGWFPLVISAIMVTLMLTWKRGRELVFDNIRRHMIPLDDFLTSLFIAPPHRVDGTAIYFRMEGDGVPHALLHNLLHNKVLHQRVIFLTVHATDIPHVPEKERIRIVPLGHECYQMNVYYGFKDERDIPHALQLGARESLEIEPMETSFFIARHTILATVNGGMAFWRESLYVAMARNARDAADFFKIPANRVIELGTQVEI